MITSNSVLFTIICVFALQAIVLSVLTFFKRPRTLAQMWQGLIYNGFLICYQNEANHSLHKGRL